MDENHWSDEDPVLSDEDSTWYSEDQNPVFESSYHCYPVSLINKSNLEGGDKIIMPASALSELLSIEIDYPMLFEMRNLSNGIVSHCGVLEFTAEEGKVYVPNWMMENMLLQEGEVVILKNTSLTKGTFFKLQPHTKDFLDISNPKAILETKLRSFSCLTTGDTIMIAHNNKNYYINVVETQPSHAISIIETDCEVDFVQPLDYKEPEKNLPSNLCDKENPEVENKPETKTGQCIAFTGLGRRLDGKPSTQSAEQNSSKLKQEAEKETKSSNPKPSNTSSSRTTRKLVFGTESKASLKNTTEESSQKVEGPKFQAFTGKKYTLG